jgi:hypothetical protein
MTKKGNLMDYVSRSCNFLKNKKGKIAYVSRRFVDSI